MKYYFQCPRCGNDEVFGKPDERPVDLRWAFLIGHGSLTAQALYHQHLRRRVQCGVCGLLFEQPTLPHGSVAKFASWILWLTAFLVGMALLLLAVPELADQLPALPVLTTVEELVASRPRLVTYFFAVWSVLISLSCWLAAWRSDALVRKELLQRYRLYPPAGYPRGPMSPSIFSPVPGTAKPMEVAGSELARPCPPTAP